MLGPADKIKTRFEEFTNKQKEAERNSHFHSFRLEKVGLSSSSSDGQKRNGVDSLSLSIVGRVRWSKSEETSVCARPLFVKREVLKVR